jgi:allantoinase
MMWEHDCCILARIGLISLMSNQADSVVIGKLADDSGTYRRGAVWISNGKITDVRFGDRLTEGIDADRVINRSESFLLPGFIDAHVHCYSEQGEGMYAATSAAAAGGVTTIVEMPFDAGGPVKNAEVLKQKQDIVHKEANVDVALLGTLWPGGGWREADSMVEAGAIGFKVSTFHTDSHRFPRTSDAELLNTMAAIAANSTTLCVHAENNEIVQELSAQAQHENPFDPMTHVITRPPVSESLGVLTAMEIAADKGAALHLCHMSIPRAIKLADWWRNDGADITLETCPQYLTFTSEDMHTQGARLKVNPPLRSQELVSGLWNGLEKGLVPVISSDHAPWQLEKKSDPEILKNSSGVPGVQTLGIVPLGHALRVDPNPSGLFHNVVKALTEGPATRFGLGERKGKIAPGYDADLVLYTPNENYEITDEEQKSNAGWTPFAGIRPGGKIEATFLRGRQIFSGEKGEVKTGHGQFQSRR